MIERFQNILHDKHSLLLLTIIIISFLVRMLPINWDKGYYTHPDEAHIYNVVFQLGLPKTISEFLSINSPLNPHFFAYGSLPLYLLKLVAGLASVFVPEASHYGNLYFTGRPLSALFDTGTLILLFLLTKKLFNAKTMALIAASIYACTVFAIQNAHFYIVDVHLTFWALLTLTLIVYSYQDKSLKYLLYASLAAGLSIATKFSGVMLIPVIIVAVLLFPILNRKKADTLAKVFLSSFVFISIALAISVVTAFILQPYALIDFATFKDNLALQLTMSKDATIFPYTLQYLDTKAYVYPITQIVLWGIGPTVGIISLVGIFALTVRTTRSLATKTFTPLFFILLFFWGAYLSLGGSAVKFMRYFLPLYPVLILGASFVIHQLTTIKNKAVAKIILVGIVAPFAWWMFSFLHLYSSPHTWIQASEWINTNVPTGTTIAVEHWDRSLPLYNSGRYKTNSLELYVPDSPEKITTLINTLYESSYIIIASNRIYDSIPNMPERYPATQTYYEKLFDGSLGFIKIAEFNNYPSLFGITKNDQTADESFTVYDHPRVQIFKKYLFNKDAVAEVLYNSL